MVRIEDMRREWIVEKVRPFYHDELVKIIVGMRRSGKSVLMGQILQEIEDFAESDHIIYANFESLRFADMLNAVELNKWVEEQIVDSKMYYIFFDEIQLVSEFERLVNSLRATQNVSIFITGSNGKLLSGELATLLSGRYVKFEITPFSFSEAIEYTLMKSKDINKFFDEYMIWGGLPHRFNLNDENSISGYLFDVYESIVSRDIVQRANIRNIALFNDLFRFVLENSGSLFSFAKVKNYLVSIGRKVSPETIYEYLDAAVAALIISKVERYNIAGKNIMANLAKYYATDLGVMQIKAARNKINRGAILENLVYNELKRRGYDVYVGYLDSAEIDFVAIKNGETEYYQVCLRLDVDDEDLIEREFGAFKAIKDNYPKYVVSLDQVDMSRDGIIHLNAQKWLS